MKKNIKTVLFAVICSFFIFNSARGQERQTIVLVHGAWGGGWTFKDVGQQLTDKGNIVYRPTMTGLGDRYHLSSPDIDINTHIKDIVNTILFEDLHDVVLLGHSYGGAVITGVADSIPDRIKKMIFLDAIVLNDGESLVSSRPGEESNSSKPVENGFINPTWVKDSDPFPHDVPQSINTFITPVRLTNLKASSIPVTYIFTVEDGQQAEDDDFYHYSKRAKLRGWKIVKMTADHNPQRSKPQELTKILLEEL